MDATPHGLKEDADIKESDKIRAKVAQTMNSETLLCPIKDFLQDYGPVSVQSDEIEDCKQFLLDEDILIAYSNGYRWKDYPQNPRAMKGAEAKIFDHIKIIVDAILKYAGTTTRGRGNQYNFAMVPHNDVESDIAGANHKMDASIVEPEYTGSILAVRFSIVPNEYKTKRNARDQKKVRLSHPLHPSLSLRAVYRFANKLLATVSISCAKTPVGCLYSLYVSLSAVQNDILILSFKP